MSRTKKWIAALCFALSLFPLTAQARGPGHGEPANITATRPFAALQTPDVSDCGTVYQSAANAVGITLPTSTAVTNYCWYRVNALASSVPINIAVSDSLNGGTAGVGTTVPLGYNAFFYTTEDGGWWETLDVSGTVCQSFTPTDQSGGGVTFSQTSTQYCRYGNDIHWYGSITYASNVDGAHNATISTPITIGNGGDYENPVCVVMVNGSVTGTPVLAFVQNTATAVLRQASGAAAYANSALSTFKIRFNCVFPAT